MRGLAERLSKKCNTYNPYRLAECIGIDYKYVDLGEKALGLTVLFDCKPIILLNSRLAESNKRYEVMAHELSHALCHADLPHYYAVAINGRGKLENEADEFAADILTGLYVQEFGCTPYCFGDIQNTFLLNEDVIAHYI